MDIPATIITIMDIITDIIDITIVVILQKNLLIPDISTTDITDAMENTIVVTLEANPLDIMDIPEDTDMMVMAIMDIMEGMEGMEGTEITADLVSSTSCRRQTWRIRIPNPLISKRSITFFTLPLLQSLPSS
jgi:hypothetical protein